MEWKQGDCTMKKLLLSLFFIFSMIVQPVIAAELERPKVEYKIAIKRYSQLIKQEPDKWENYFNRGYLRYYLGGDNIYGAVKDFKKACKLSEDNKVAHYNYEIAKDFKSDYVKATVKGSLVGGAIGAVANTRSFADKPELKSIDNDIWSILKDIEEK